jgi:hypothetical protein
MEEREWIVSFGVYCRPHVMPPPIAKTQPNRWRSMEDFNPDEPAMVHDHWNDVTFKWVPEEYAASWHRFGDKADRFGFAHWNRLMLDGWKPLPAS